MLKLFALLKPRGASILLVLLLMLCSAMADLYLPTLMADIVNIGVIRSDFAYILRMGPLMLGVAAVGVCCSCIAGFFSSRIALGFSRELRRRLFSRIESFSFYEFDAIGKASLITRTTNDVTQVQQSLIMMMSIMVRAPIMCAGGIALSIARAPRLSLVFAVAVPLVAGVIFLIARNGMPLFRQMQQRLDSLNGVVREKLAGVRVVRAFDRIEHEKLRFNRANEDLTFTGLRLAGFMSLMMPLMMLMMNLTIIAIVWLGSVRVEAGAMQVGDVMAFIQYALQILFSLMMLSMLFIMVPRAQASAVRISEVLGTEPRIKDLQKPRSAPARSGRVEFRNVNFTYSGAAEPALSDVSFSAGPGEITAIVGGSGSGKTTLVSLIPRFYDVDGGAVLVDGMDIREMAQETLRRRIGFVPQKAQLFTGTIARNIRFGNEGAADAEVLHAAQIAQAGEFIAALGEGMDAPVSQGGVNLSGGQRQRLAIARALAIRSEIYIFDDSFSALDFRTDALVRRGLRKEMAGSTVFIVAQRVATVMDAERIVVLDEGRVAGIGAHRDLMQGCAVYHEIVRSQLGEGEAA